MRPILESLLKVRKLSPKAIQKLTGANASTIYRFLRGIHDEPHSDAVSKWAFALGVTEHQLRGLVPIDLEGVAQPVPPPPELDKLLTVDELRVLACLKKIDPDSGELLKRLIFLIDALETAGPSQGMAKERQMDLGIAARTPERSSGGKGPLGETAGQGFFEDAFAATRAHRRAG